MKINNQNIRNKFIAEQRAPENPAKIGPTLRSKKKKMMGISEAFKNIESSRWDLEDGMKKISKVSHRISQRTFKSQVTLFHQSMLEAMGLERGR